MKTPFKKETLNIYQKLHKIQCAIKGLGKDKESYSFQYVTGNKLLSYIRPLMDKYGLLLKQEVLSIDNTRIDYVTAKNKPKSEMHTKVMMRFTWIDIETGDKDENLFGANGQNDWEKGLGSALTYAERYFLMKYFHISTDEDDIDNPDRKPIDEAQPKAEAKAETKTEPKPKPKTTPKKKPNKLEDSDIERAIEKKVEKTVLEGIKSGIYTATEKQIEALKA